MTEKYTLGYFVVGEPDTDDTTECPICGFDAVLRFPSTLITDNGVTPFGHFKACCRCWEESRCL